jgi:hypothetical protein
MKPIIRVVDSRTANKTFTVIATIKQTIKAESKEEAINYANSLIDLNGGVSFNTGKINYKIKEVSDDND